MSVWKNSATRFGLVSVALHWVTALLVLVMFALAWGRDLAPRDLGHAMIDLHKSIGITILGLTVFRLVWTYLLTPPPPLPAMPAPLKLLAKCVKAGLYLGLLGMVGTGWGMISAGGRDLLWFGLFRVPALLGPDKALSHSLRESHETVCYILLGLIGLHAAGALYHHLILKDGVLRRITLR